MSEFLTTRGVSDRLEQIIRNADEHLILISPYLQIDEDLKELIQEKDRSGRINIYVIYGKIEPNASERRWLGSLSKVHISFRKNLHAKCYLNENHVLLTSMNLYEFSEKNNDEMGLIVSRAEEPALYSKISKEVVRLRENSEARKFGAGTNASSRESRKRTEKTNLGGFCIRGGEDIALDPKKPYCKACFRSWDRFKDDSYVEKYCHRCRKQRKSTMSKPVCRSCRRKLAKT